MRQADAAMPALNWNGITGNLQAKISQCMQYRQRGDCQRRNRAFKGRPPPNRAPKI